MKEQITLGTITFAVVMGLLISMLVISITTPKFGIKHSSSKITSSKTRDKTPYSQANAEPYADKLKEMQYIFDNINLSNFKVNNNI